MTIRADFIIAFSNANYGRTRACIWEFGRRCRYQDQKYRTNVITTYKTGTFYGTSPCNDRKYPHLVARIEKLIGRNLSLVPLNARIFVAYWQISTLVTHRERPFCSERSIRALARVGQAVSLAIERFVTVGETIADDNPEIKCDMYQACKDARSAGAYFHLSAIEYNSHWWFDVWTLS